MKNFIQEFEPKCCFCKYFEQTVPGKGYCRVRPPKETDESITVHPDRKGCGEFKAEPGLFYQKEVDK